MAGPPVGIAVQSHYTDAWGRPRRADRDTVRMLRAALDVEGTERAQAPPPVATARGAPVATCHLPAEPRRWGWAAQLYAVRSRRSWGIGDLEDLRRIGRWAAGLGAGFLQLNPLHAAAPVGYQQPSPYFPSSRRFRSPLYVSPEHVPGFEAAAAEAGPLAARARELNTERLIHRDEVHTIKMLVLEAIWRARPAHPVAASLATETGVEEYALYCALAERHGPDWRRWPAALRSPGGPGARRAARELRDRVSFHAWIQQVIDHQLERAARVVPPILDLAAGAEPGGADAWAWAPFQLQGFNVGAPPDPFNPLGQDWGFQAFDPRALARTGFAPLREMVRANMRHALGLRIDHVLGFFRLWLIPHGAAPDQGAYVNHPAGPMLDVVAEESRRAQALVVGEDLGTVQPGVRAELRRRRILSYRLLWFEPRPPERYPRDALAAVTTHDLPTVAGMWSGTDDEDLREAGLEPPTTENARILRRLARLCDLAPNAPATEAVLAMYRELGRSPSRLLAATLEDALVLTDRTNMPGTTDTWPNWSLALPGGLEGLRRSVSARSLARVMAAGALS